MQSLIRHRRLLGYLLFVYTTALLLGTHLPQNAIANLHKNDKAIHFVAYSVLALLAFAYWAGKAGHSRRSFFSLLTLLLVFAALDEFTQQFSPGRFADRQDWLADCAGIVLGAGIWMGIQVVGFRMRLECR